MLAAYETNLAAVEMLLKVGANPNIPSRTGCNAIVACLLRANTVDEVLTESNVFITYGHLMWYAGKMTVSTVY